MLMKKKEPTPHITKESKMPPDIIKISDNSDSDEKDHDEIEASLKQLFPGQSEVSILGREEVRRDLPGLSRSVCLQLQNQSHHIPLRVKTWQQQLENKLRNCFDNFKKVDTHRTTVLKQPLIRF